ncbi:MAG TPA: signal peptide peptidase SppA, partial [Draconibacterium sp.]|nr:signal peptide peptidase SppA [Draconibacterium sp.]
MKEFFKYVLATIVGFFAISLIGFLLIFIVIGAIVASSGKEVKVAEQSMLVLDLSQSIVDRAPNDPFQDIELPGIFSSVKTIGLDNISKSLK